jgi:RNA polymerase sigma factor (sigma-70 family)
MANLVAAAASGDRGAVSDLIQRHTALVWSIAWNYRLNPADAADVTQVVWLRLLENLGRIRQPDSLGAWLGSVTSHECLRLLRRRERELSTADDVDLDRGCFDQEIDDRLLGAERDATVRQAFAHLPVRGRRLLEALLDAPSASYQAVADAVGIPIGSIGPTRQRCLERLREAPELVGLAAA